MSRIRLAQQAFRACLVGGAALGAMVVMPVPEVRAACLPTNPSSICASFDPSTASNIQNRIGFIGSIDPPGDDPITKARVQFRFTGAWSVPINLDGISLSGPGITSSLDFGSLSISTPSSSFIPSNSTAYLDLNSSQEIYDSSLSSLSFILPANVAPIGATLEARLQFTNAAEDQLLTTGGNFVTVASNSTNPVPGPLPILGAGSAFAFSRKLRRRIRQSA